jgi:hypothetical protein
MKYRKLRIAWSTACGILCLLLIALWVRSYFGRIGVEVFATHDHRYEIHSLDGKLLGIRWMRIYLGYEWTAQRSEGTYFNLISRPRFGLGYISDGAELLAIVIPYWLPSSSLTVLAATLPWLRWCFSLRTLLVAATLVAVILSLAVMMLNKK